MKISEVKVVDLFCGIGGLTHGLRLAGFDVVAGVDNDPHCKFAYEKNNKSKFITKDITDFTAKELEALFEGSKLKVLVGCAPCQPFSTINVRRLNDVEARKRWAPLYKFMDLIKETKPDVVSMENVPDLANPNKYPVFHEFVENLKALNYRISYKAVDVSKYGIPQKRKRLVLLASRLGNIELIPETHDSNTQVTVRDAIGMLPAIEAGECDVNDPLHRASKLSLLNQKRIKATPQDGGTAKSWPKELMLECYKKPSGRSYMCSVYGRMRWDEPAPTMTTHCVSLGTGRFGHPTQNRAISLREAALFQTFPVNYQFAERGKIQPSKIAKQIGNAVPVKLGQTIGQSIRNHLEKHLGLK